MARRQNSTRAAGSVSARAMQRIRLGLCASATWTSSQSRALVWPQDQVAARNPPARLSAGVCRSWDPQGQPIKCRPALPVGFHLADIGPLLSAAHIRSAPCVHLRHLQVASHEVLGGPHAAILLCWFIEETDRFHRPFVCRYARRLCTPLGHHLPPSHRSPHPACPTARPSDSRRGSDSGV